MEIPFDRSLIDLGWPELCEALASRTLSDLGHAQALALSPAADQENAEMRLSVMAEVMALLDEGASLPAGMVSDSGMVLTRVSAGAAASGPELAQVAKCLRVALRLDQFGQAHEESAPLVGRVLMVAPELRPLLRAFDEAIDDVGEVLSDASPGLSAARTAVRKVRDELKSKMSDLISRYREALQDGYFAERDGRYVLPVRVDAPFRVEGLVLGTSSSGSTLYIEPKELAALGNRLRLAEGEVERQVAIVLARLSEEVAPLVAEIRWAQEVCARADLLRAIAELAASMNARVLPFAEPGQLNLIQARHPLLCLSLNEVVPSDLSLGPGKGLVLSGPNAGGKTVALKTLGLLALMHCSGMPVPADEESSIGFFDEVFSDIGDDQSLSMSLSTFSGHVQRVKEIFDEAAFGSLVLFDELMGGTDPDEGAVLAIATLDALVLAGASVCVTTHYEPLKKHAAATDNLENGAVGFDFERMEPTFMVSMGRAGASSAIVVAEKHGLSSHITARALALLPEHNVAHRAARLETESASAELARELKELKQARAEQEELNRRLQRELEKQRETRRKDLNREGDELRAEVRAARNEVRRIQGQLKGASSAQLAALQNSLDKAARVGSVGGKLHQELTAQKAAGAAVDPSKIKVGSRVNIAGFSTPAEVVEPVKKGQVRVLAGVMKMSVALKDITSIVGVKSKAPAQLTRSEKKKALETLAPSWDAPMRSDDVTLNLRGKRVEESLLEVDHFIDELLRRQERGGYVLHGHGTGALREAVRTHLRAHQCVEESRPAERDEGGDAFTVFWLVGM